MMLAMIEKMLFLKAAENRESFFDRIALFLPRSDPRFKSIERAYDVAKDAFRGKFRDNCEERYFEHLRAVALILVEYLRVKDHELIIAALIHDIVEDIPYWTIERVRLEFGDRVAYLVDYMSKPALKNYTSKVLRNRAYHDRFAFAPREFFLLKLADRLHNVITLAGCAPEKRRRKIEETKLHYLPYAEIHLILLHELEEAIAWAESLDAETTGGEDAIEQARRLVG